MVYELAYCFINVSRMTMDGITGGADIIIIEYFLSASEHREMEFLVFLEIPEVNKEKCL